MLTDNESLVYSWLWGHKDDGRWPSGIELAIALGLERMTVSRALNVLEGMGAIKCIRRGKRQRIIMDSIEVVMTPREVLMASTPLAGLVGDE